MAVQIFYQYDFLQQKKSPTEIKNDLIANYTLDFDSEVSTYREKIDKNFLDNLISGMMLDIIKIDGEISAFLKDGWNLEKIDDIARQILRFATFELQFLSKIPARVIIDEYVHIAASFFATKKITFVNGILENLAKKLRLQEFRT
jgi:N utilization substance protein B